ncbi:hypothetical protein, partial [uncultured Sutterella sp.]|uniref:hypothetical protein n=1 Tax=uncultured Sutterella sp. TaxID=286133 RepID=UPI0026700E8D
PQAPHSTIRQLLNTFVNNAAFKVELSLKREAAKRLSESGLQHLGNSLPQQKNVAIPNMNSEEQL